MNKDNAVGYRMWMLEFELECINLIIQGIE